MNHDHGPHECYCPGCGIVEIVDANIPCNTLPCPGCGQTMRASQTGEYLGAYHAPTTRVAIPVAQESGAGKFVLGVGLGLGILAFIGVALSRVKVE